MAKVLVTDSNLSGIADTIRAKNGGTATYKPGEMAAAIAAIPTSSSSDFTLQAKTATPSESSQTIVPDSGYDGLSSVTVGAISTTYVGSGVTKKAAATYTPTTSNQTIAAGQYLSGAQTIKGDTNLTAANIKSGTSIFGVTGSYEGTTAADPTLQSKSVTPSESSQTVTPDSGYDGLSSVTVGAISSTYVGSGVTKKAAATYTPTTSDQTIAAGQYLSGAQTIKGDTNLVAGNIKSGTSIFGVTGSYTGDSSGSSYQFASGTITTDSTGYAYITEDELPFVPTVMLFGPAIYEGHYMAPALFFGGDSAQVPYGQCLIDSGVLLLIGKYSDTTLTIVIDSQGWNWSNTLMTNTSAVWYAYKF